MMQPKYVKNNKLQLSEIIEIISAQNVVEIEEYRKRAFDKTTQAIGNKVFMRGLVEFSNICEYDCYYCGIRHSNKGVKRFCVEDEDIINAAILCKDKGLGSIVLQSGQRSDEKFIQWVEDILIRIKQETTCDELPNGLGITLSAGEQTSETYRRWFDAGAHRYLLRIETCDEHLYKKLHPIGQAYSKRIESLESLADIGYQVGTGVMIGLPCQDEESLARDIVFMRDFGIDMIGMGPYIIHEATPMKNIKDDWTEKKHDITRMSLNMIAAARLAMPNVNIASTTALAVLSGSSKANGIRFGANVIMPQVTANKYRYDYDLYRDKTKVDIFDENYIDSFNKELGLIERELGLFEWGDSPHYFSKIRMK